MKHKIKINGIWTEVHDTSKEDVGVAAQLIAAIPAVDLSGKENVGVAAALFNQDRYLTVFGGQSNSDNGLELESVYNIAKTMSPTSDSPIYILIKARFCGMDTQLVLDTSYIYLVSDTGQADVKIGHSGCIVMADNIKLRGLDFVHNGLLVSGNYPGLLVENCKGRIYGTSDAILSGVFRNIEVTSVESFHSALEFSGIFENINSIGGTLFNSSSIYSGTFKNINSLDREMFAGGGSLTGSFENCGNKLNNTFTTISPLGAKFINCKAGQSGFRGSNCTYINCEALENAFNGVNNIHINCRGIGQVFNGPDSIYINCIGGVDSCNGVNSKYSYCVGDFGALAYFGSTYYYCRLTDGVFQTDDLTNHYLCIDGDNKVIDSTLISIDPTSLVNGTHSVLLDAAGTLHVENISQLGASYETHAEQVLTTKNEIILRDLAVAGLSPGQLVGIRAKLYDGVNDGLLVFDNNGIARVGDVGSTQPLATREEVPIDKGVSVWDAASLKFKTIYPNTLPVSNDQITKFVSQNGGIIYHTTPWTISGTISTNGTTITGIGTAFSAAMIGAKIIINSEERIIATYISATSITVGSPFSINYNGFGFGIYNKWFSFDGSGNAMFFSPTSGINSFYVNTSNNVMIYSKLSMTDSTQSFQKNTTGIIEINNNTLGNYRDLALRYVYQSITTAVGDAVGDIRHSNQMSTVLFEKCTVANATKGSGTWVTLFKVDANGNIVGLYNQPITTVALPGFNIDMTTGEEFSVTMGTNQALTIMNPIIKKPFKVIMTGGTLATSIFSGYTSNWIYGALQSDYVPLSTNYLQCEIRSAGQIYLWWGM